MSVDNPELSDFIDEVIETSAMTGDAYLQFLRTRDEIIEYINVHYVTKAQASKDMAEVIGEDDPRPTTGSLGAASNPGTVEGMFYTSRKDLRIQQRKTAASKGYKVEGE